MRKMNHSKRISLAERKRAEGRRFKAVAVSLALAGVLAVGGATAFLTDKTSVISNTFQPAEVTCEVHETFENNVKKNVYIENTGDVDAYVRAEVIINWMKVETVGGVEKVTVLSDKPVEDTHYAVQYNTNDWAKVDGYWYCMDVVQAGGATNSLINSIALKDNVAAPEEGYYLSVEILASAIQNDPADAVKEAWKVSISDGTVTSIPQSS